MRVVYLFTTFPVASETFLQREVRAMQKMDVRIDLYSLHGGDQEFEGIPVKRFNKIQLLELCWQLPMQFFKCPRLMSYVLNNLKQNPPKTERNWCETLLGLGFAIVYAAEFQKNPPDMIHAVWATMPATAALVIHHCTGIPFSFGAHAYDVFRVGGDCLLNAKIEYARFIHTTTTAAKKEILQRGANPKQLQLIRRGLEPFPSQRTYRPPENPLRILSVGRIVEKKGYTCQMRITHAMKQRGIPFQACIVGTGEKLPAYRKMSAKMELDDVLDFTGALPNEKVIEHMHWADLFLYTGKIASNADRDGLPNVIAEAMAIGVPIVTTPVSGIPEAIEHEKTGLLVEYGADAEAWIEAITRLSNDSALRKHLITEARIWVEKNFDAEQNAAELAEQLKRVAHTKM